MVTLCCHQNFEGCHRHVQNFSEEELPYYNHGFCQDCSWAKVYGGLDYADDLDCSMHQGQMEMQDDERSGKERKRSMAVGRNVCPGTPLEVVTPSQSMPD